MKRLPVLLLLLWSLPIFAQLRVSDNKRFLVQKDGTPFFWLGDTGWELFHRLNRDEADRYLKNRADKGFTVIQAVVLAELDGLHDPNPYGEIPLANDDPTKPREAYFRHVDYIIDKAATYGLYIGLLPTWADKINKDRWGVGPEIFTPENARWYGRWLANRYRNRKNIIWILGGDRNPRGEQDVAIWRAMAAGIEAGAGGADNALMTFHPQPNSLEDGGSSKWFHKDAWLDFNMFQTGHCRENNVWDRVKLVCDRQPYKPVLDGETLYEDHPVCFNAKDLGISSAYDVRKHAWLDVFAGAFGHTYGCHDIWQMYAPNRQPVNGPHFPWYEAMDLPGAGQMQWLRRLVESRPMLDRVPDQNLLLNAGGANDRIQATRGKDYLFVYSAQGRPVSLNMGKISGTEVVAHWYDPRTGSFKAAGKFANNGRQEFTPPASGYGQDWVLVVEDTSKAYPTEWKK
ncbi:Putative collagen-binding domain of a collagenase [Cnuella takakiae]|uniref:Putative collagen-binding domain of a collagenase n=1 Tax=Cnuella takakiae TaxID=1302690 RepID=A0A1M5B679_9BACT|nr:glycoside hydrolase family 140 protein [Cnuella takakiae]OLY93351.1 hypothetical protein BUE76_16775 [Cnuella takakiae]SHF37965.1 Putative collagen-binding domain of a collagenase [Cnuella takakiae]